MRVQRERSAERAGRKEVVLVTATTRVEAGANLKPRRMGWYLNDHATNLWGATFATTYDTTIVIVFTICLQGSIKKRHPSGRKRTRDLPDYARVVYRACHLSRQYPRLRPSNLGMAIRASLISQRGENTTSVPNGSFVDEGRRRLPPSLMTRVYRRSACIHACMHCRPVAL